MGIAALLLGLFISSSVYRGRVLAEGGPPGVFDVTKFGAVGDGKAATNEDGDNANSLGFIQAWRQACDGTGVTRLLVPKGTFLVGPVLFTGPCKATVTVDIQGTLVADPDISQYTQPEWLLFENVNGVTLTGTGVVDGNGAKNWRLNDCPKNSDCAPLPTSIKYHRVTNGVIERVQSLNSMFFHIFITNCHNVTVRDMKITAPANSPNTDGIHMSGSDLITISNTVIGTGDDCVSVGHSTKGVTVTGVTCGPGHGISVGSLGKYKDEHEVSGITVKNCTLIGTTNGARIKSWPGKNKNTASAITYEDIIMDHVQNPIIIDQTYGKKSSSEPSQVKISDVHFKNIRGTSVTKELATFTCSSALPCEGIEVADVNLVTDAKMPLVHHKNAPGTAATCLNAKVTFVGKNADGLAC